jgi:SpoVK/Ycf46/Vps4 family AAA+-type ATPase
MILNAICSTVERTAFSVSMSHLVSRFQGDSEKMIEALFDHAKKYQPALIIMEECDAVGRKRTLEENEIERRIKIEFLKQLDSVLYCEESITFIATTNVPWELDAAFLRRFEKKVLIPLPSENDRKLMIENKFVDIINFSEKELKELARLSNGFSGVEISNLINETIIENGEDECGTITEVY